MHHRPKLETYYIVCSLLVSTTKCASTSAGALPMSQNTNPPPETSPETGGFTYRNVHQFDAELPKDFLDQSTFDAATVAQSMLGNIGGVDAFPKELGEIISGAHLNLVKSITEPLESLSLIPTEFENLAQGSFAAATGILDLDIPAKFLSGWAANLGHMEDLLPKVPPMNAALTEALSTYREPVVPIIPIGVTVAEYQLEALRDLQNEVVEQRRVVEATARTTNTLLDQVRTEIASQRRLLMASLGAALLLSACAIVSLALTVHF